MSKKFRFLSCLIAVFALALMAVSPVAFAGPNENANENASKSESSSNGSENTPGNDRKEGYEDNSTTPQDSNHGKGSDRDGDAGNESHAYTEDDDTNDGGTPNNVSDDGDNAHPSGKDKSVENGGSGTQGKAESNPDDSKGPMRYEGAQGDDKPNGPGGTDLADQDGNNGCGNDDDFDDDNNGWCGKPDKVKGDTKPPKPCDADAAMPGIQKCDEVKGVVIERCPNGDTMPASGNIEDCNVDLGVNPSTPEDDVLGEIINRDKQPAKPAPSVLGVRLSPALTEPVTVAGAVLPFTGGDALIFLAAAMALIAAGVVALKVRHNEA